ncbi:MAG: BrnT family toxin [Pseudomonadales bacterium]
MDVVWDPEKARSNLRKHNVDFADAAIALEDENALSLLDDQHIEYRFRTLARGPHPDVLLIVHSEQDEETIRIISARKATKEEERQYFTGDFNE